jgi:hypothetical protein
MRMAGMDSRLQTKSRESRRAERFPLTFEASLRGTGAAKFSVDILDLSVMGYRCEATAKLDVGARVWLTIPGLGGLESCVMWHERFQYGCAFTAPMHPAVLDHIARRQRG